jgi:hypothetical protein
VDSAAQKATGHYAYRVTVTLPDNSPGDWRLGAVLVVVLTALDVEQMRVRVNGVR